MTTNLPSGYHREMQLIKDHLFPAFQTIKDCMVLATIMFENIIVKEHVLEDTKYDYLFSVEVVNDLVLKAIPFRDAYKQIGEAIENGTYKAIKEVNHTHEGSIGNLCHDEVRAMMKATLDSFEFKKVDEALEKLIS